MKDFFGGLAPRADEGSVYALRRKELIESIKTEFSHIQQGIVVLFGAFEQGSERFRQDKTFFYYTGVNEPGTALVIDLSGKSTLYIPNCFEKRAQWLVLPEALIKRDAKVLRVDAVELLGDECAGYELNPYFSEHEYAHMIARIKDVVARGGSLCTTAPDNGYEHLSTRFILGHLHKFIPELHKSIVDVSEFVAAARRIPIRPQLIC
ncbi:MAG TPA: aminopeptidase P N-terminal domain-containing protein, partial [Candidatus Babeliales bacterium]|nr:aminopeptidase P N-terminal domain-containing protein [Candidatus Babeliales bacterium]